MSFALAPSLPKSAVSSEVVLGDLPLSIPGDAVARSQLQPAPLRPSWILEGSPEARALPLCVSADGNFSVGLWDCTGGRFEFHYRSDELIQIIEGEVTVLTRGILLHLKPGDMAYFPKGSSAHWTVHGYVKKLAIFRSEQLGILERIVKKLRRMALAMLGIR